MTQGEKNRAGATTKLWASHILFFCDSSSLLRFSQRDRAAISSSCREAMEETRDQKVKNMMDFQDNVYEFVMTKILGPHFDRVIPTACSHCLPIHTHLETANTMIMTVQHLQNCPFQCVPCHDLVIVVASKENTTTLGESNLHKTETEIERDIHA